MIHSDIPGSYPTEVFDNIVTTVDTIASNPSLHSPYSSESIPNSPSTSEGNDEVYPGEFQSHSRSNSSSDHVEDHAVTVSTIQNRPDHAHLDDMNPVNYQSYPPFEAQYIAPSLGYTRGTNSALNFSQYVANANMFSAQVEVMDNRLDDSRLAPVPFILPHADDTFDQSQPFTQNVDVDATIPRSIDSSELTSSHISESSNVFSEEKSDKKDFGSSRPDLVASKVMAIANTNLKIAGSLTKTASGIPLRAPRTPTKDQSKSHIKLPKTTEKSTVVSITPRSRGPVTAQAITSTVVTPSLKSHARSLLTPSHGSKDVLKPSQSQIQTQSRSQVKPTSKIGSKSQSKPISHTPRDERQIHVTNSANLPGTNVTRITPAPRDISRARDISRVQGDVNTSQMARINPNINTPRRPGASITTSKSSTKSTVNSSFTAGGGGTDSRARVGIKPTAEAGPRTRKGLGTNSSSGSISSSTISMCTVKSGTKTRGPASSPTRHFSPPLPLPSRSITALEQETLQKVQSRTRGTVSLVESMIKTKSSTGTGATKSGIGAGTNVGARARPPVRPQSRLGQARASEKNIDPVAREKMEDELLESSIGTTVDLFRALFESVSGIVKPELEVETTIESTFESETVIGVEMKIDGNDGVALVVRENLPETKKLEKTEEAVQYDTFSLRRDFELIRLLTELTDQARPILLGAKARSAEYIALAEKKQEEMRQIIQTQHVHDGDEKADKQDKNEYDQENGFIGVSPHQVDSSLMFDFPSKVENDHLSQRYGDVLMRAESPSSTDEM